MVLAGVETSTNPHRKISTSPQNGQGTRALQSSPMKIAGLDRSHQRRRRKFDHRPDSSSGWRGISIDGFWGQIGGDRRWRTAATVNGEGRLGFGHGRMRNSGHLVPSMDYIPKGYLGNFTGGFGSGPYQKNIQHPSLKPYISKIFKHA